MSARDAVSIMAVFLPSLRRVIRAVDAVVDLVRPPAHCELTKPLTHEERELFHDQERRAA